MASKTTNYQCPACTGPLHYVGKNDRLECDYCGNVYTIQAIQELYPDVVIDQPQPEVTEEEQAYADAMWGDDADHMRAYSCSSCGAEIMCEETTAATSCPYCGNPTIVPSQFSGSLKPELILPFKLTKEQAVEGLKRYYHGKKLLPKNFSDENHIQEIKGIYVPFWLYDGEATADVSFTATRVSSYTRGDTRVTITDHFAVRRAGRAKFHKIPADGSSKMPDAHMDAIEPYDYADLKPFSLAYLPGFLADRYDVTAEECQKRATLRAENTIEQAMQEDVRGYASVVPISKNVGTRNLKVHYALLPVWLLSTRWNDQCYLFAMNGQTGKFIGNLPVSGAKVAEWFAKIAVPAAAVMFALLKFVI